jgi:hypothetical protein
LPNIPNERRLMDGGRKLMGTSVARFDGVKQELAKLK